MKTKIIKALAYITLITVGLYFVGSFVSLSFNALTWVIDVRIFVAVFWVVFVLMAILSISNE